jgi:thymidylate synthase
MNRLDKQYQSLLKDILDNGTHKMDRTGTGTISVFGRQIRHKMSTGFPLLTTKKMPFKTIATELIWFLRGDTNIKYLVDNNCHIWDGDAYKNYEKWYENMAKTTPFTVPRKFTQEELIQAIKLDDKHAELFGELGPIYGAQWREWVTQTAIPTTLRVDDGDDTEPLFVRGTRYIDQIENLIRDLKTNPDSRRLMVSAWNVSELDQMVLPPCHYGFQVYTRELSLNERGEVFKKTYPDKSVSDFAPGGMEVQSLSHQLTARYNNAKIPTRAISLMWNQRSVDTFLGLPFNIASYGLLLEIIAKAVNMVPDELIGNLGDVHLYSNHIEQAKEQIGRRFTPEERQEKLMAAMGIDAYKHALSELMPFGGGMSHHYDWHEIPYYTREPYALPRLNINTEFWPTESGECGVGPIDAVAFFNGFTNDNFCKCLLEDDLQLSGYKSHPTIKAPLSN